MLASPRNRLPRGLIGLVIATAASNVQAINITVEYDATQPNAVSPEFDPNGTQLKAIASYVAAFYEEVFEDAGHSLTFTFWYTDLADGLLGDHDNVTNDRNDREVAGNIKIDTQNTAGVARNYFFDPTPATNGEFTMTQLLWRDLSFTNRADWYNAGGGVPQTFETSFAGSAPTGSPAAGANDMLTLVFHEMGHALGMSSGIPLAVTETSDGDYDFNPAFLFGGMLAADNRDQANDFVGHLDDPSNLMFPTLSLPDSNGSAGVRKVPSHADLFAMAAGHSYLTLDVPRREFYNPNGDWNTAANWSGNRAPDHDDDAFVRNGAIATLSQFGAARNLSVLEGALVSTQANTLFVENRATVAGTQGNESQITIHADGQLDSDFLMIESGGRVMLENTGLLESKFVTIERGGELRGRGTVFIDSALGELTSAGLIRATDDGDLVFMSLNSLALNLGGEIEAIEGNIRFDAGMSTPLTGTVTIGPGREVMFRHGGSVAAGGSILLEGTANNPAIVSGLPLSAGLNGIIHADGVGVIENTLLLAAGAILETAPGEPNAELRLAGNTLFQGGSVLGEGLVRQIGNVTVEQNTQISIHTYDMDGLMEDTVITVNPDRILEIHSDHIDTMDENDFDGTIHVNSGTLDIAAAWRLDGTLNLNETTPTNAVLRGAGGATVAGGGKINIHGDVDVETSVRVDQGTIFVNGDAVFSGTTTLGDNAVVKINTAEDSLQLRGETQLINPSLVGSGRLIFDGRVNVTTQDAIVATNEADLDGIEEETAIVINQGLTFSITSTTIEPADNDGFDGFITNHGTLSVAAGWRLDGELTMSQIGATVPSLAGPGTFRIHSTGMYSTEGGSLITPPLEVAGAMVIEGGITHVDNSATFEPTANVVLEQGAELALNRATTFRGGSFTGAGLLQLNAITTVDADTTIATGHVDLNSTEDANVVLNNAAFVLNVDRLGATDNVFNGRIHAAGESARMEVNLNDPTATWRIATTGILSLITPAPAEDPSLMLQGSDVSVEGRINASGHLRLGANIALHGELQTMTNTTNVHFAGGGQNLVFNGAIIDGDGGMTIASGTRIHLEDDSNIDVDVKNAGRLEVGFLTSEAELVLSEAASATIHGDFTQSADGTFGVDLGGAAPSEEFDVLNITGTARLGGRLEVKLTGGFVPAIGDTFQVLTAENVVGTFDSLVASDASNIFGLNVSAQYTPTDAVVHIEDLFLLGDYNRNGAVDAADFILWRDTLGETGMQLAADGNGNDEVDSADFDLWRAHFGNTVGAARRAAQTAVQTASPPRLGEPTASVPEAPSVALACSVVPAIIGIRRVRCKFA